MRGKFIAGNWKMYKYIASAMDFCEEFKQLYVPREGVRVAICAPYLQLPALVYALNGTDIAIGAQNMHFEKEGAYTGEISAEMLTEVGTNFVIIGHSERRMYFNETDERINLKVIKALATDLLPIVCVGESLEQREVGLEHLTVENQLRADLSGLDTLAARKVTIAYEPVWAIGTGKTATPQQAQEMCAFIRSILADMFGAETAGMMLIQYGGSVKPKNAKEILTQPDIDGALVGGASLVPKDFWGIINYENA